MIIVKPVGGGLTIMVSDRTANRAADRAADRVADRAAGKTPTRAADKTAGKATCRTVLITGGSRGIGNAIALRLAQDGYAIAVAAASDESTAAGNIQKIREACDGRPFIYIKGNIALEDDRKHIITRTISEFGRLDVLVNNAGVAPVTRTDILETTEESFDRVMDINLKGTFFLTQLAAKVMIRQSQEDEGEGEYEERKAEKEGQLKQRISGKGQQGQQGQQGQRHEQLQGSVIINISSVSAYATSTNRGEYCISKAGISMVTALFADRLALYGIRVYEIRPGIIMTDMTAGVQEKYIKMVNEGLTPIRRLGCPEDVAEAAAYLCSGKLSFSTGEVVNVDGGFHLRRL